MKAVVVKSKATRNGDSKDPNLFRPEYRELKFDEKLVIRELKDRALAFSDFIDAEIGHGRGVSIAKERLEEAVMWLTKFVSAG